MSNDNIRRNRTMTEIILSEHHEVLRIEYNPTVCRIMGMDLYVKSQTYSAKGNSKFKVTIYVESIPDDEGKQENESRSRLVQSRSIEDMFTCIACGQKNIIKAK